MLIDWWLKKSPLTLEIVFNLSKLSLDLQNVFLEIENKQILQRFCNYFWTQLGIISWLDFFDKFSLISSYHAFIFIFTFFCVCSRDNYSFIASSKSCLEFILFNSYIQNLIYVTPGVLSVTNLEFRNYVDTVNNRSYSDVTFDVKNNIRKGILYPPPGGIFEFRYPDYDIIGRTST